MLISLTVDHGPEFTCKALDEWAWQRGVKLDFTRPGKPTDNSYIESFNGRLRDECLNVSQFLSIEDAKEKVEVWRMDCTYHRPHGSFGHLTPSEFIHISQKNGAGKAATVSVEAVSQWDQRHCQDSPPMSGLTLQRSLRTHVQALHRQDLGLDLVGHYALVLFN